MASNNFLKLSNNICGKCRVDCCLRWSPFFSEYDKKRIRKINKSETLFSGNLFNTKNKRCPFYNKKYKKCTIHQCRPLDCRIYPYSFWFEMGRIDLWLDLKCPLSKQLIRNNRYYKTAMSIAKNELIHWSEGKIFGYLMAGFNIEKFKKLVGGKKRNKYYTKP